MEVQHCKNKGKKMKERGRRALLAMGPPPLARSSYMLPRHARKSAICVKRKTISSSCF